MEEKQFTPKQWVLVRDHGSERWKLEIYSHYEEGKDYPHICLSSIYRYCIQYEGNEHLLNSTAEPKKPYVLKDGDFATYVYENETYVSIYKNNDDCYYVSYQTRGRLNAVAHYGLQFKTGYIERRLATQEEKQKLIDAMHKDSKDWDDENKKVVDWKWQPQEYESYYCPTYDPYEGGFCVHEVEWEGLYDECDKWNYEIGWTFRTEDECQALCDKLNEAIKNVK